MAFARRALKKFEDWLHRSPENKARSAACFVFGKPPTLRTETPRAGEVAGRRGIHAKLVDVTVCALGAGELRPAYAGSAPSAPNIGETGRNGSGQAAVMRASRTAAASRPMMAVADGDATQAGESITSFEEVYARYHKQIFNAVYQWIGDYEEASDLTQETFVSAFKALDQFRGESRIYTWLYRIAYNHCKNRFKQRDRQRQMEGVSLDAGVSDGDGDELVADTREIADWSYSPAKILEQKELRALVDRAVDSLASEYKVVLLLRELDGLSYNEIAEVTGLTMEAVKTRLNRARGMVRQRVEPYYKT